MAAGLRRAGGALVFIGFMGSGKSTAAREAATRAGISALDSDRLVEQRLGHSIEEHFERHGEAAFRGVEEEVVCELLERAGPQDRVSLGGGAILSERTRAALARHTVVLLEIDAATAWERASGRNRPLARDRDAFAELHAERSSLYEGLADAILPARRESLARAMPALEALLRAPAGTQMLWAGSAAGAASEYPVQIGAGLLEDPPWPIESPPSRRLLVSDETVGALHGDRLTAAESLPYINPGEQSKTLAEAERLWAELAERGVTRADHLVALGGGVVGDLAGFVAATYQRGIPIVHVPTTLVAQVDSAYGGKTAIDLPAAKNYVGAYHQPAAVLVDPAMLDTLPAAERAAGYAEVLKTALIAGGALWQRVARGEDPDLQMIAACARCKLEIVAADERDGGRRQVLNLGHTVAHAIETVTGYQRYRHGEAVALGLLAALRLSGAGELRAKVAELVAARGLPTQLAGVDPAAIVRATTRDKKRTGARVPFVLVRAPGDVTPGNEVADADLLAAVSELAADG